MGKHEFSSMEERELPGIENLNALNANMEKEEQVQRHIEKGNLSPEEVALYIMQHGSTGQKISMLQHLNRTIQDINDKKINQLITELCESLWTQDLELQCEAPAALINVLPMLAEHHTMLLFGGAKTMLEVRTLDVRKAWGALALESIGFITPAALIRDIVPWALKKSDHSCPGDQRQLCCQLIGRMSRRLSSSEIQNSLLTKAIGLCQDTDVNVRVAMCNQLPDVSRAVGLEIAKDQITAELFELLVDEEKLVSRAAFTCLIDLVEFFEDDYRREHFYPIIRSYISNPPEEVLTLLIEEFGRFLYKIRSDVQNPDDVALFANFFRSGTTNPDNELRRMCAFNFPAVVASLPISAYPVHLSHAMRSLAADTHVPVRRAVAAGFHEYVTLLADKAFHLLKDPFLMLLQDPQMEVRSLMMENLGYILSSFNLQQQQSAMRSDWDQLTAAMVPALVAYEQAIRKDWRKVGVLFKAFPIFPSLFISGMTLHDVFMPILFFHLREGANALKEQCAELIVLFTTTIEDKNTVVDTFLKLMEFGNSMSCYQRASFVQLFRHCCSHYSRKFLMYRMFDVMMELAKDPVEMVRVQVARVLPRIREMVKRPSDPAMAEQFRDVYGKLLEDPQQRVAFEVATVVPELDAIEREYARQDALRIMDAPDDIADKAREDAEGDLIELSREQEKQERRQKLRELLKSEKDTVLSDVSSGSFGSNLGTGKRSIGGVSPTVPSRRPLGKSTVAASGLKTGMKPTSSVAKSTLSTRRY